MSWCILYSISSSDITCKIEGVIYFQNDTFYKLGVLKYLQEEILNPVRQLSLVQAGKILSSTVLSLSCLSAKSSLHPSFLGGSQKHGGMLGGNKVC